MGAEPNLDRFTSRRSTVYGTGGIVATSQPLATDAGVETLRRGGTAFDAAVATAAVLNVVEPMSTGVGGDAFALYRTADGEVGALQSCGGAPAEATVDRTRDALASEADAAPDEVEIPAAGPHAVTVPGALRGWEALLDGHGRFAVPDLLDRAIEYATEGYPVSEVIAGQWGPAADVFTDAHARGEYLVDGRPPRAGEVVRHPTLGRTLRTVAEEGVDAFYEGPLADRLAAAVRERGGFLHADDLASFAPEFVDPVSTTYAGAEVYELPPNNQGLIALEALNVAEAVGAGDYEPGTAERVHYFVEALKRAFHDGHHYITDPAYEDVPALGSKTYARSRAADIDATATTGVDVGVPEADAEDADTVLLTVADGAGNVVSFINSLFANFGSGIVPEGTGVVLQNRGSSFSLSPDHPNSLEPGKRPFHTLIPGLVRFDDDDWAAFGVMGGFMQPQGHVQVLSNLLDAGLPLQAALDTPRWRYRANGTLAVEGRTDGEVLTKLSRMGHDVTVEPPGEFGGAQVARNDGGVLSGATDPRKDGLAGGF
jgi:gamma-glutamyltranspeptidase/glutathione hydrolase